LLAIIAAQAIEFFAVHQLMLFFLQVFHLLARLNIAFSIDELLLALRLIYQQSAGSCNYLWSENCSRFSRYLIGHLISSGRFIINYKTFQDY